MSVSAEIKGLQETQRNLEQLVRDLKGTPLVNAVRTGTLLIERDAKRNLVGYQSPTVGGVDTGRLRASITPEVRVEGQGVTGVIGSNLAYAPYVEMDTRPHWPPRAALEVWAERHHTSAFLVARAIARRGTYGKHYLEKAFDANAEKVKALIERAVSDAVQRANT